jgi:hypothetical protein
MILIRREREKEPFDTVLLERKIQRKEEVAEEMDMSPEKIPTVVATMFPALCEIPDSISPKNRSRLNSTPKDWKYDSSAVRKPESLFPYVGHEDAKFFTSDMKSGMKTATAATMSVRNPR